jgi:hypothetical protein
MFNAMELPVGSIAIIQNRGRSLSTLPPTVPFRTAGVPPALLTLLCTWIL